MTMRTSQDLKRVLQLYPDPTKFGFGVYKGNRLSPAERREKFRKCRTEMYDSTSLDGFERAREWLVRLTKTRAITRCYTSYGLKHVAEADIGYVSNGIFIAAAISAGFNIERCGPNAYLNIRPKAWRPSPRTNVQVMDESA